MGRNFYYGKDATIVSGSRTFAAMILGDAESFGLSGEQAASYAAYDAVLQDAYKAATTPATRTPVAVGNKDMARNDVQREATRLAQVVYATPTVSDAQLISLGLRPRPVPGPRPAPAAPPVLKVVSVVGRVVRIRIRAQSPDVGRKPAGTVGAEIYSHVGEEAVTDPRAYHYEGLGTRATYDVVFPNAVASGATVRLSAVWVNRRGVRGIASAPLSVTIQGGPVVANAA